MTDASDTASTKTRDWFYSLSSRLLVSFQGSASIQHKVTKGESRELQILDVLRALLPTKATLQSNVIIVDADDAESPKFDGVLFDRASWPLLYANGGLVVAMIESVVAAFEIKSELNTSELDDILSKARKLLSMKRVSGTPLGSPPPRVTAFSYECANPSLMFFDYCTAFSRAPSVAPASVCILNQALFTAADATVRPLSIVDVPEAGTAPVLLRTGKDTLLVYLYFLSRWVSSFDAADSLSRYAQALFTSLRVFFFDLDFLELVASDDAARMKARRSFSGRPGVDVVRLYDEAREEIGLEPKHKS